jgi:DNA-binding IclR family transcriptional regulator
MHTKKQSKNNHVPGVHKAIDVLEFIASAQREISFSELFKQLDIPRQSLVRVLNTLCDRGFFA